MQYAATISLARTLLGAGRPDDVARMIEPLAPAVVADPSEAVLHALLARVALLSHADPAEAEAHLRPAGSPISFDIPDVDLWQGWLNAWPYAETFRPASARYHLERAHRLAVRDLDVGQQCWALLGGALLYLLLDEPLLSRHLLQQARRTGWLRHDREAVCWMYGIEAVLALRAGDYSAATDAVEQLRDPANDMAAELYRFRALALELRLAVSTGRDERSMADTVLDRIGDAARTYCPAAAEIFLCRVDQLIRDGEYDQAGKLLGEAPPSIDRIIGMTGRLEKRKQCVAVRMPTLSEEPQGVSLRSDAFGTAPGMELPFWRSLPSVEWLSLPLVITGERGTGKKHLARQIHQRCGRDGRFVAYDCGLTASESAAIDLFGDEPLRIAGLFADTTGGTLLLRDIDRLPVDVQRKLARALATVDQAPHVIATLTCSGAEAPTSALASRELADRIMLMHLHLPPLRECRLRLPLLIADLIAELREPELHLASITDDALRAIMSYSWPGNIRQLKNELERMLTLVANEPLPVITTRELPDSVLRHVSHRSSGDGAAEASLEDVLAQREREIVEEVLIRHDGQVASAADELGLTRQGLYKKIKRLGIDTARFHTNGSL